MYRNDTLLNLRVTMCRFDTIEGVLGISLTESNIKAWER